MNLKQRIGLRIKAARKLKGLTQAQLAERTNRAVETISNIERGFALTGLDTLEKISKVLNVPVGYFFEGPLDRRRVSKARIEAEEALLAAAWSLSDSDLSVAVAALEAMAHKRAQ